MLIGLSAQFGLLDKKHRSLFPRSRFDHRGRKRVFPYHGVRLRSPFIIEATLFLEPDYDRCEWGWVTPITPVCERLEEDREITELLLGG